MSADIKLYGYGVVDKDGEPWWEETCVWADEEMARNEIDCLNENEFDKRAPYQLARLFWKSTK